MTLTSKYYTHYCRKVYTHPSWSSISLSLPRVMEGKRRLRQAKRDLGWLIHAMTVATPSSSPGEGGAGGVARFLEVMSSILSEPMYVYE